MRILKRVLLLGVFFLNGIVFAENFDGVLPSPSQTDVDNNHTCSWAMVYDPDTRVLNKTETDTRLTQLSVGTKIKGGCLQLSDIPRIIIGLIDLFTKIAGTIAVGFIVYAGFQLIMSGVTENREAAKNTIKYALMGLAISLLAWVIVNVVQVQLTI